METTNHQAPLHIWRLIDGKPGHEKQSLGLVLALSKLEKVTRDDIKVGHSVPTQILQFFLGRFPDGKKFKKPNLIIGAGHRTHFSILAAKRAYGGKSIVLMKPSLPYFLFDLCLVPEHDKPPKRANIIPTIGALNTLGLDGLHKKIPSSHLILIGGPSPHYKWDNKQVIDQVEQIVKMGESNTQNWVLATSPRTPKNFPVQLEQKLISGLKIFRFEETNQGWIEKKLSSSENVWITPDSVSMVFEALSASCKVGLFKLDIKKTQSRVVNNIQFLVQEGYISQPINLQKKNLPILKILPNQAEVCARYIESKSKIRIEL